MPDECRPPEGTPDGTVCNLIGGLFSFGQSPLFPCVWRRYPWWRGGWAWMPPHGRRVSAADAAKHGWRFHSIAEVPHD